jgi:hypothetical protein
MSQYDWLWSGHMIIKEMLYIPIKLKPELACASMTTADVNNQLFMTRTRLQTINCALLPWTFNLSRGFWFNSINLKKKYIFIRHIIRYIEFYWIYWVLLDIFLYRNLFNSYSIYVSIRLTCLWNGDIPFDVFIYILLVYLHFAVI